MNLKAKLEQLLFYNQGQNWDNNPVAAGLQAEATLYTVVNRALWQDRNA